MHEIPGSTLSDWSNFSHTKSLCCYQQVSGAALRSATQIKVSERKTIKICSIPSKLFETNKERNNNKEGNIFSDFLWGPSLKFPKYSILGQFAQQEMVNMKKQFDQKIWQNSYGQGQSWTQFDNLLTILNCFKEII